MNQKILVYRILTVASLASGIVLNLIFTDSPIVLASYYTLISNLFCLFALIVLPMIKENYPKVYSITKGAMTVAILLTACVYLIALLPNGFKMYVSNKFEKVIANLLVHIISPSLVVGDYFLFDEKGHFELHYSLFWLAFPMLYVCFVYIAHAHGLRFYSIGGSEDFAYFFLDYQQIGMMGVARWISMLSGFIIALGYILILLDKKLANRKGTE